MLVWVWCTQDLEATTLLYELIGPSEPAVLDQVKDATTRFVPIHHKPTATPADSSQSYRYTTMTSAARPHLSFIQDPSHPCPPVIGLL